MGRKEGRKKGNNEGGKEKRKDGRKGGRKIKIVLSVQYQHLEALIIHLKYRKRLKGPIVTINRNLR